MPANHALGGARVHVGLRTALAYQMCSHCEALYPSLAECVCVYCEATVCPGCVELLEDIDEVVCLACAHGDDPRTPEHSQPSTNHWPALLTKPAGSN